MRGMVVTVVVAIALILAALSSLVYWRASSAITDLERSEYARLAGDVRNRVDRLIGRDKARLADVAFSDALYQAIDHLTAKPDSAYQPPFADWFPRLFGDRFVAIYDLSGHHLYRWNDVAAEQLEQSAVTNAIFRMLDNREAAAGLVRQGERLYWVTGAPILPRDRDPSQPIKGYVLAAQPFRLSLLGLGPGDVANTLTLTGIDAARTAFPTEVESVAGGDSVRVRFTLGDIFAVQNTRADAVAGRAPFQRAQRHLLFLLVASFVGIAGLAFAGVSLGRRWIVSPIERLASALKPVHDGQLPSPLPSLSPAPEWDHAVGAVNRLVGTVRATQERFDRAFDAVRDGIWEQDLNSGEWTFSRRFRVLLGYEDAAFPDEQESLLEILHPEERDAVLEALQRSSGTGSAFTRDLRLHRADGTWSWYRLEAEVLTDHAGSPVRFQGRLIDLSVERRAAETVRAAQAEQQAERAGVGRFLAAVAGRAAREEDTVWRDDVELIGRSLAGILETHPAPFDLLDLLQEVAGEAPVQVEVAVAPNVAVRVDGDRALIRRALVRLRDNAVRAARRGRVALTAERADQTGRIRLVVENRGEPLADADRIRAMELLGTEGDAVRDDAALGLRVVREVARTLGGSAGIETSADDATRVWITLPLPEVAVKYEATAAPDYGADANATFWPAEPAEPPAPVAAARTPAEPAKFELVADETVVIDFDAPTPTANGHHPPPATPSIVDHLRANPENPLALQMATVFLKEGPSRLRELRGSLDAQDPTATSGAAQSLKGMAALVGAPALAEGCDRLEAAALVGDEPTARERLGELETEFARLQGLLEPHTPTRPAPVSTLPPIDPATLAQLRASLARDGAGLGTQLVSLFLAEMPVRLETMDRAARGGDRATLTATAAELKGMCALVGAAPMAERCDAMSGATDLAAAVAHLRAEFERAHQVLGELLHARMNA
jgi:PAS domain S-box-containing protein